MSRYAFIVACVEPWPVQFLCQVLGVSPAGYYQWRQRRAAAPAPWQAAAQEAFTRHARRYGTRRLRAELRAEGHAVGRYALRTWLRPHRKGQGRTQLQPAGQSLRQCAGRSGLEYAQNGINARR